MTKEQGSINDNESRNSRSRKNKQIDEYANTHKDKMLHVTNCKIFTSSLTLNYSEFNLKTGNIAQCLLFCARF